MHVGQSEVTPLETVGEPLVVDPEAAQDRCVEVMDVHRVADDVVAVIVCLPVCQPRLHPAPGCPDGEAPPVMVATVVVFGERPLTVNGPPKLAAPDHQRLV